MRTEGWEGNQARLRSLPADVRTQLEDIYTDIGLLNNLVWLSSEFNRSSPNLRQRYVDLAASIADRLDELVDRWIVRFSGKKQPFESPAEKDLLRTGGLSQPVS